MFHRWLFLDICNEYAEKFKLPKVDNSDKYDDGIRSDIKSMRKLAFAIQDKLEIFNKIELAP